jgi:hypothetical protein
MSFIEKEKSASFNESKLVEKAMKAHGKTWVNVHGKTRVNVHGKHTKSKKRFSMSKKHLFSITKPKNRLKILKIRWGVEVAT